MKPKKLSAKTEINIRFCEVDLLKVVWHGNYYKYFEDGRNAFALKYGLDHQEIYNKYGLAAPVVYSSCSYKSPLRYGDKAIVETIYVDTQAAKAIFDYKVYRGSDNKLVAEGKTIQVFVDKKGQLHLTVPEFLAVWKEKWLK